MRVLIVLVLAVAVSGCGLLRNKNTSGALPKPWYPNTHSKIDDTHRDTLHSNDPARDSY